MENDWSKLSITKIKTELQLRELTVDDWYQLAQDSRQGVQQIVKQHQRRLQKEQALQASFVEREHFEQPFWQRRQLVAGIDEVGRGPLAGPVVVAAVILPPTIDLLEINDSKQLSDQKRHTLYTRIVAQAVDISVAVGSPELIDQENIYHATELTMAKAVAGLFQKPAHLLVDAMHVPVSIAQTKLIKGDARSVSIGAASIIAKVYRDELMKKYAQLYPGYGFEQNAGYGTKVHLAGLKTQGICPIHRKTFAPVKNYLG
ncbi:ribonuclease HII [Bombilactobacillus folatiphilus]|uniref:Ribonuclease HII n=1 Tax=Bombilactobacillus folatiphilus TaxID=2923362 RepID=A0ABY4PAQ9_9LACO|nr:ribonuclease HII [Bombilactobacillus folatiphilus]UQS82789.1 ribonuclease HII [Bombilactobacillus folatiphilus]